MVPLCPHSVHIPFLLVELDSEQFHRQSNLCYKIENKSRLTIVKEKLKVFQHALWLRYYSDANRWGQGSHFGVPKWRQCECPKPEPVLWEFLSSVNTFFFAKISLYGCWPREWKRSVDMLSEIRGLDKWGPAFYCSKLRKPRLLRPSIVFKFRMRKRGLKRSLLLKH